MFIRTFFDERSKSPVALSLSCGMETSAQYVVIGSLTLAVIAAVLGFVLWFQTLHNTQRRSALRVVVEGSAAGLRKGSSINFNGVRVGEVTSVTLDNPRRVVALAMLENSAPIRKDTHVGLEFQGLTGVAAISLKGGEDSAFPVPPAADGIPTLTADPAALQDVAEAIRGTLQSINRIVADDQQAVTGSLGNIETFTASLAGNSERIDTIMSKADGVMTKADAVMSGLDRLAGGKHRGELLQAVTSIRELAESFDKRSGALMADGRRTLGDVSQAVNNLDKNPTRLLFGVSSNSAPAPAPPREKKRPARSRQ
jgi:phospholipid/cholesterol/gamma-HCH transport system substrate-binding protein